MTALLVCLVLAATFTCYHYSRPSRRAERRRRAEEERLREEAFERSRQMADLARQIGELDLPHAEGAWDEYNQLFRRFWSIMRVDQRAVTREEVESKIQAYLCSGLGARRRNAQSAR